MYQLTYTKAAVKALRKMPRPAALKMQQALQAMAKSPFSYRGDWKPMQGAPYWRLRSGDYRAICSLDKGELTVLVLKVGARGDVYK